ncbi:Secoisolariciresinol dehydrogenase [Bienertia sinuspersici]
MICKINVLTGSLYRLKGKVAIISGGASGFGKSTAKLFVKHGAKVVICDVEDEQGHCVDREVAEEIISYIHCDITNEDEVKNLIDLTISKHGKLDIMFNNAGIFGDTAMSVLETTSENFKKVFETNVYGGFLGAKHAARVMIPRKSGVVCESNVLKGVLPQPLDVANAALFMASDEAKFVSGLNLFLDGGNNVTNPSFSTVLKSFWRKMF